jgi:hypothetical protein
MTIFKQVDSNSPVYRIIGGDGGYVDIGRSNYKNHLVISSNDGCDGLDKVHICAKEFAKVLRMIADEPDEVDTSKPPKKKRKRK